MSYRSIYRPGLFDGPSIVITGGGSGIGRCTAHELVSLGARVALVGRSMEKLKSVQAELSEAGGEATVHTCDIRDEEAVKATVAEIIKEQGAIHGLVNNAGGQFPARLEEITLKGWDAVIKTNLTGGFLFARECYVQWMKENGGGPIVNMVAEKVQAGQLSMLTKEGSIFTASMMRDLKGGLRTEHEHILGDLIAKGTPHSIDCPLLKIAYTHMAVAKGQR